MRLIDADALPKYTGYALSADEVAMAVENAPTIDAVPVRHGRWINEQWTKDTVLIGVTCSNCMIVEDRFYKYCPNCGAKMDEGGSNGTDNK